MSGPLKRRNLCKLFAFCGIFIFHALTYASPSSISNSDKITYQVSYCNSEAQPENLNEARLCRYASSPTRPQPLQGLKETERWMRLEIIEAPKDVHSFSIWVAPFFLKEIELFQVTNEGATSQKGGSHFIREQSHGEIGGHLFTAPATPSNGNTYYIKLKASDLTYIFISVKPWPTSNLQTFEHLLGIGAQIGMLAAILVFALVSACLSPSAVMARFSIYVANIIVCTLSGSGILALYLFKGDYLASEFLFHSVIYLRLGLLIWVSQALLEPFKTPAWYRNSCWAVYALVGISITLFGFGYPNLANPIVLIGIVIAPLIQVYAITKTPDIGKPFKVTLIIGFCSSITFILLAGLTVLFPLSAKSQIPLYLSRLSDFVTPVVILSAIIFQGRLIRKELVEVKNRLYEINLRSEFEGKALRDRKLLIDMLAHELKNSLSAMGLAIDTLSRSFGENNLNDQRRLKNINQSIVSMDEIIERCSLMNIIDQKSLQLSPETIVLEKFLLGIIFDMNCSSMVETEIQDGLTIETDPNFLRIILNNLIENALKYSPLNCPLKIQVTQYIVGNSEQVIIEVSNTVRAEMIPNPRMLFQRFYRHPTTQNTRGSGLGLYICKELCDSLNAVINCKLSGNRIHFIIRFFK